eukprot:Phypoly_transcript_07665.p1 GENE.Phypoly_transcript_07665~~Phypoly_transcript_07665.p1  ORF type:complete len:529 (+),score=56.66 Phypoly_transcript_07665:56-1588(+)
MGGAMRPRKQWPLVLVALLLLHDGSHFVMMQNVPFYIPFYDQSANGFTMPSRGWNSFGLQANPQTSKFVFNDANFRQQCSYIQTQPGYDYYCSLDSGWSVGGNGDEYGRLIPEPSVISNISDLASFLHSKGLLLGVYVLPGAFTSDANKLVYGTNIKIGSLFNTTSDPSGKTCNDYNARNNFIYSLDGVQQWHNSVVNQFAEWGIDFIKLDYVTPGSPDGGCMPYDSSASVVAFHNAIKQSGRTIRLDISWKLDRELPYWEIWRSNADSLRTDQDINNANSNTLVSWATVQRAIENYRIYITQQTLDPTRQGKGIQVRPDMDNAYVGNPQQITGLSDVQRYSVAIHWIGAGANYITGSDMTNLDSLGKELLYNEEAIYVADFTSQWPMQPRNPEGWGTPGGPAAMQLQAWISGPNDQGTAVVILTNLGPDLGQGGFGTNWGGVHNVSIALNDLGIGTDCKFGGKIWSVRRVWGGGGSGGPDHTGPWNITTAVESWLGPGESVLYKFQKME